MKPPVRTVRFLCVVIGVAAVAPAGRQHFGRPGLFLGIMGGALLGLLLGWWMKRSFLDL